MTVPHTLEAVGLQLRYGDHIVIDDLDLTLADGRITAIVGANGCGKSTLLRSFARLINPTFGQVRLDGRSLKGMPTKEIARTLAMLPQSPTTPEGIVVSDLVGRGRHPHQRALAGWSQHDFEIVAEAMDATGISELADRFVDELSGGQRQRAWIAMTLAQETDYLLLDEPTTYLDLTHQIEVLDLLTDLNRQHGKSIVMVLHDLNLASRYADHLIAMKQGRVISAGTPSEIVTSNLIAEAFDLDSMVIADPVTRTPLVVPIGRHHVG